MATHRHGAGSSPRGRGKPKAPKTVKLTVRLIPARAGKTPWTASLPVSRPAHPRAGGENAINSMGAGIAEGSSPRGRGQQDEFNRLVESYGLIPARAGKTDSCDRLGRGSWAHPRAGGENAHTSALAAPHGGLIPARAGKTCPLSHIFRAAWAHPRAGGENTF